VVIRRARYQCSVSGKFYCPVDALLDLPAGTGGVMTVSLSRRALALSTRMDFHELQRQLLEQHDVSVSDTTLDVLMQRVGGVAEADRQNVLDALLTKSVGVEREEAVAVKLPAPRRMYVSCDGIFYPTRYKEPDPDDSEQNRIKYQEMKVGTVFWQDQKNRWHKRVVSSRDDSERFGLNLWHLAVECGMLNCPEVIFISDGGGWCNTVAQTYFKEALRILDWYHLSEHVWETGRKLYPGDETATGRWVAVAMDYLHDHSGRGLLMYLERSLAARGETISADKRETLQALINYLSPRLTITEYVAYREKGYVIGSGMMESTCKQVVSRRLKGPGMQWSERGALAIAALIGQRINGSWPEFWQSRPLQRAA